LLGVGIVAFAMRLVVVVFMEVDVVLLLVGMLVVVVTFMPLVGICVK